MRSTTRSPLISKYRAQGVLGGGFLGALLGALIAAPKVHDPAFSATDLLAWVSGGAAIIGLAGYIFVELFISGLAGGPGASMSSGDSSGGGGSSVGGSESGDGGDG